MKICFYTPFKPLDHIQPSGDLVIASGLFNYLAKQGHQIWPVSDFRARWIFWKPWRWPSLLRARRRAVRHLLRKNTDLWLTYHSYYKAPDLLGPSVSGQLKLPYVIFQGIYSTKRRRDIRTWPGYVLNKNTLCAADHVFTNKRVDLRNLARLLPKQRLTYVVPGIDPNDFCFDPQARRALRRSWNIESEPVILSAAMFRPDVKTEGLSWVIRSCGQLFRQGLRFQLVIAGDGTEKPRLLRLAETHLPGRTRFLGKLSGKEMRRFYSAGDFFVFPGINESLGMVFLEAQSCGLPVVAFANAGVPEAVWDKKTGVLVPLYDSRSFVGAIESLLIDKKRRRDMGRTAAAYVRQHHDINNNYKKLENVLETIVRR